MKISEYFKAKKQAKQAFKLEWTKYLEDVRKKSAVIDRHFDIAYLEEVIQQCNNNPGLHIKVTLNDGTILDLVTSKEQKKVNPLFTEAAYEE